MHFSGWGVRLGCLELLELRAEKLVRSETRSETWNSKHSLFAFCFTTTSTWLTVSTKGLKFKYAGAFLCKCSSSPCLGSSSSLNVATLGLN